MLYFGLILKLFFIAFSPDLSLSFGREWGEVEESYFFGWFFQLDFVAFNFFKDFFFTDFLERRARGREINQCESEKHVWAALCPPTTGDPAAAWACALTRNLTGNPSVHRMTPNKLSHTGQGVTFYC